MSLVLAYVHNKNIVVISDGRESAYTDKGIDVMRDDKQKLVIYDNHYVIGHLGLSKIVFNEENFIKSFEAIELTKEFLKLNKEKMFYFEDKHISILAEYLVDAWNHNFRHYGKDYLEFRNRFSLVLAKWTNGIPQIFSYSSHCPETKQFLGYKLYGDNILSGDIVNNNVLTPYRDIKLNELTLEESINLMLKLFEDVEVDSPTIGGKKQVYLLNENPLNSRWYKY